MLYHVNTRELIIFIEVNTEIYTENKIGMDNFDIYTSSRKDSVFGEIFMNKSKKCNTK